MVPPLKNVTVSAQRRCDRALAFKQFKGEQFQDQLLKVTLERLSIPSFPQLESRTPYVTNPDRDNGKVQKQIRQDYPDDQTVDPPQKLRSIPTQFRECRLSADRVANLFNFNVFRPLDDDMLSSTILFPDGAPDPIPQPEPVLVKVTPPASIRDLPSDVKSRSTTADFLEHGVNKELIEIACASETTVELTLAELVDPLPSEHLSHYEKTLLKHAERRVARFQRRQRRRKIQAIMAAFPTSDGVDPALRILYSEPVTIRRESLYSYRIRGRLKEPLLKLPYSHPCGEIIA